MTNLYIKELKLLSKMPPRPVLNHEFCFCSALPLSHANCIIHLDILSVCRVHWFVTKNQTTSAVHVVAKCAITENR